MFSSKEEQRNHAITGMVRGRDLSLKMENLQCIYTLIKMILKNERESGDTAKRG